MINFIRSTNEREKIMQFFNTTTRYKEMVLLEHIEKNTITTQKEMANVIEGAVSMVNTYLDNLESRNYIKREYISQKIVHYHITPEGTKQKNYLQITYIKELMDQYIKGQESVHHFLEAIQEKGFKDILLYGAGEVAEIILDFITSQDVDINVLGVIDDNPLKQGNQLKTKTVYANDKINEIKHDGIVITSYAYEDEIKKQLKNLEYPTKNIIGYFEI